jgi:hypothetical protein
MTTNLVKIFERIRDEPLHIPEELGDKDNRCCGKSRKLKELLEKEGYELRFRVCAFKWSKQRFPKNILDMAHKDNEYHLYLEIRIDNKWVILDCSNDSKLPSYNVWDGFTDCNIAVNYDKILSPEESSSIENKEKSEFLILLNENKKFYNSINHFFEELRKNWQEVKP